MLRLSYEYPPHGLHLRVRPGPAGGQKTNRVQESRNIFQTIVNNIIFENISVILFLNKVDLLEQKVPVSNITHYFPEFKDATTVQEFSSGFTGNPNSVED